MNYSPRFSITKEFPIERIFRKIMRRKMNALERTYFHLKPLLKRPARKLL
jgi:hypothetical protein